MSLREISRELGVALSSVSVWTRDVQPPAPSLPQPSVPVRLEPAQVCPECGRLVREGYRLERVKAEIARCELVCANCHRRRTAKRVRSWRVDPEWRSSRSTRPSRCRNPLFLLDYLRDTPCVDCGERDPVVLDFDHIGVKRSGVVQLAGRECSIANLEAEMAQCEVRCANCHRRRTIVEQAHFRHHLVTPP
jgi:hypothetical protein